MIRVTVGVRVCQWNFSVFSRFCGIPAADYTTNSNIYCNTFRGSPDLLFHFSGLRGNFHQRETIYCLLFLAPLQ